MIAREPILVGLWHQGCSATVVNQNEWINMIKESKFPTSGSRCMMQEMVEVEKKEKRGYDGPRTVTSRVRVAGVLRAVGCGP